MTAKAAGRIKTKIVSVQEILRGHDRSCLGRRLAGAKDRIFFLLVMNEVSSRDFRFRRGRLDLYRGFLSREKLAAVAIVKPKAALDPHDNNARKQRRQIRFTQGHKLTDRESTVCRRSMPFTIKRQKAAAILDWDG